MGENIEVKDVQKTEYLDKNGLDMLWAKVKENTHNQVEVERNRAVAKENSIIDTKADKSALDNYVLSTTLAEYAKKTDIPEVDTSDFVSKTTTDAQAINSTLSIVGGIIQIVDYTADEDPVNLVLASTGLEFNGSDNSAIELNASSVNSNNGSRIRIEANNENPHIALQSNVGSDYVFSNNLKITNEGISSTDNNANHVFATDGSIADLAQYAKKSEITAGGNVDDVQVNGVSVVENKIANIKPATKEEYGVVKVGDGLNVADGTISVDTTAIGSGKYIPYETFSNDTYYLQNGVTFGSEGEVVYTSITNSGVLVRSSTKNRIEINGNYLFLSNSDGNTITFNSRSGEIEINRITSSGNESALSISGSGIYMYGVGRNRVLTADASTIDITQYALKSELPTVPTKVSQLQNDSEFITKSVYDEKIAALESRIAALEAKHTETA